MSIEMAHASFLWIFFFLIPAHRRASKHEFKTLIIMIARIWRVKGVNIILLDYVRGDLLKHVSYSSCLLSCALF